MKICKIPETISGLNRYWGWSCLLVAMLLLAELAKAQTLVRILADDYTLGGTGDSLIKKEQYVAGLDNPDFRTTSAIVDELRIRVYDNAAVVTGRTVYRGWSKKGGKYVHRFRFTDTFIRRDGAWKCVATHASGLARE